MAGVWGLQKDKAGWTGQTGAGETWEQFDALPRGVKRLFWEAPFNYTALDAWKAMVSGLDLRGQVERQRDAMARDVARETRRVYGPDHPQARRARA